MEEMNLLSWREEKKVYERGRMKLITGACVVAALCIATMMHVILAAEVRRDERQLQAVNAALPHTEITLLNEEDTPGNAQLTAEELTKLLDDAAAASVNGMCFTKIAYHENRWRLEGLALSPQSLTAGLGALQAAANSIKLSEFNEISERDYYRFILNTETLATRRGG